VIKIRPPAISLFHALRQTRRTDAHKNTYSWGAGTQKRASIAIRTFSVPWVGPGNQNDSMAIWALARLFPLNPQERSSKVIVTAMWYCTSDCEKTSDNVIKPEYGPDFTWQKALAPRCRRDRAKAAISRHDFRIQRILSQGIVEPR